MLVALAGGVGAARLLAGLVGVVDPAEIVAVVNTGDDMTLHGLHISPDVDTVLYTLGGRANPETGWGLAGESWTVMEALGHLGGETWFRLGDRDLATHLYRSQRLSEGATLSEVTAELARSLGLALRVVPMSDDPVRTRLDISGEDVAFQDYFVRRGHGVEVSAVRFDGADAAGPAPGVLQALSDASLVVICPSNPVVSIGPILALGALRRTLEQRRDRVVAVSPIVAGRALKGPADRLLRELGHESSSLGVARLYREIAGTLVVDEADGHLTSAVEAVGMRCVVTPTVMSTPERARALGRTLLGLGSGTPRAQGPESPAAGPFPAEPGSPKPSVAPRRPPR